MNINWDLIIKIAVPLFTLGLGKYLDRWLEKRSKLIVYLGHASAFTIRGNPNGVIHTHAVVLRNAGREAANNVRLGHHVLPENFQIYPAIPHEVVREPNGAAEIVIPKIVPNEQVTVSYLYFPPLLWSQIHSYTKSDEGFAKALNVIPTPQPPRWMIVVIWSLVFIGSVSLLYLVIGGLRVFIK